MLLIGLAKVRFFLIGCFEHVTRSETVAVRSRIRRPSGFWGENWGFKLLKWVDFNNLTVRSKAELLGFLLVVFLLDIFDFW